MEIIVSDGGSNDNTAEIAKKLADKVIIGPRSRYKQLNSGGYASNGKFLLFLHADTNLPEAAILKICNKLKSKDLIGGAFKKNWNWKPDVKRTSFINFATWFWQSMGNWLVRSFKAFPGDNAIFVRREAFIAINGYAPLWICEDFDFIKRLKKYCKKNPINGTTKKKVYQKLIIIDQAVLTSTRRFEKYGFFKIIYLWFLIYFFWRFGMSQEKLKSHFQNYSTIPEKGNNKFIRF
jgi:cellulose synthase/poly-beta-1,6-N-acetylglucosamine synthase-like glycosyltransferase